ncbi:MAG TPA: hypothetical protein VNA14_12825 [Mycobacteriales bacterium]|nr:hypothetical protein [Mycobacteriales bacterium]
MPRRPGLLLVILLSLLALLRPSYAEAREGISLKGNATGYVDVFVHRLVDIRKSDIVVKGGGRYAGFYMVPDTSTRRPIGALAAPGAGAGGDSGGSLVALGEDFQVAPGTYRLYLIAERGPTEVFIPIPEEPFIEVRPRHSTHAGLRTMSYTLAAGATSDERRIRVRPARTSVVAALQQVTSAGLTGTDYVSTCVVTPSESCGGSVFRTTRLPLTAARSSSHAVVRPSSYDAAFRVERGVGVHSESTVSAAVFSLALVWMKGSPNPA